MKKGFTLIELLAVIVILAILALISSPIISGVINDAKKASAERSVEGYIKAVEYAQVQYQYKNEGHITQSLKELSVSAQGMDKLTINNIKFNSSGIVKSATILVNEYRCTYLKNKIKCKIPEMLNKDLINTLANNSDSGLVEDENELGRYYFMGAEPKNKILLKENDNGTINNIDYRIISFEKDGTIKVVRDNSIGKMQWDLTNYRPTSSNSYCSNSFKFACNAWGTMKDTYRYNELMYDYFSFKYYFNNTETNMRTNGKETGDKTEVNIASTLNTYLNTTYLESNLAPIADYLDEHMWIAGGITYRSGKTNKKDMDEIKSNQWKGYIAVPNIIDYKNASSNTLQCTDIYSLVNVVDETPYYPCSQNSDGRINNYLYKQGYRQWLFTVNPEGSSQVWNVNGLGALNSNHAQMGNYIYPSFYLNSDVKLTGTGTDDDKFVIVED